MVGATLLRASRSTILIDAVSFAVSADFNLAGSCPEQCRRRILQPRVGVEVADASVERHHPLSLTTAGRTLVRSSKSAAWRIDVRAHESWNSRDLCGRDLGFAAGILGTIWALGGLSSLIGAVSAGSATRRFGIGPAMILRLILYSVALLFVPLARGATLGAALLLIGQQTLGDGAATLYQINQVSLHRRHPRIAWSSERQRNLDSQSGSRRGLM